MFLLMKMPLPAQPLFLAALLTCLAAPAAAQSPPAADSRKEADPCRQSGSVAARLANYRLLGKPLDALIAEIRESGVEEAPTPKVEQVAREIYALGLLPAEAFDRYRKACPFKE